MTSAELRPWTNAMRLGESSTLRTHCYADRFSIVRVETTGPLTQPVRKSSSVPALLVSMFLRPVAAADYALWVDGKIIPTGSIRALHANVIDLGAEPTMWGARGGDYVHFHLRREAIDDTATVLGYKCAGDFRLAVAAEDIVLAQLTKSVVPFLSPGAPPSPLALDQFEQIVAAHVIQRYGAARPRQSPLHSGLAGWQAQRAKEFLRENLNGNVRLVDLASACNLSVSHFARMFKLTFGVSCHRWLIERRVEHAKELPERTNTPLADIASQAGFGDQAAFTRTFHRLAGLTPACWRRENGQRGMR